MGLGQRMSEDGDIAASGSGEAAQTTEHGLELPLTTIAAEKRRAFYLGSSGQFKEASSLN